MTIGRRFWNMARSELNSLLDKAKDLDGDGAGDAPADDGLREFSEAELEAELQRRTRERAAEQAARASRTTTSASGTASAANRPGARAGGGAGGRSAGSPGKAPRASDHELRKAYAALEVPFGADLDAVKKSYRALMRKYHPDRHTGAPEKQKTAHDLAQRLTLAYTTVKHHHERR